MSKTSKNQLKQFYNCRILRGGQILEENLWVRDGKIIDPEKIFYDEKIEASVKFNCDGAVISPGFIDVQINGGFGIDFSYNTQNVEKGINLVAKGLLSFGVTSFCPTIVTSPKETYHKILPKIKKRKGGKDGAAILGIHVEGPFISPLKNGAHSKNYIRIFENGFQSLLELYGSLENICYITLAPEIDNAMEVIKELKKKNIKVSVGHSAGNLKQGEEAIKNGATLITHLFNAMLPFHHRDPGLVGLLTSNQLAPGKVIYYGIIADGVHTHPAALRIAHKTNPKGIYLFTSKLLITRRTYRKKFSQSGLILVTDAISALGLEEGIHQLGQLSIEVRAGSAYIAGTNTLCGSIANMAECVRFFKEATGCSLVEALESVTLHPAEALEIQHEKGVLDFGTQADFVLLDNNLHVLSTWIAGDCVYDCQQNF
ncbi:PREDICTED: putative N-acetylglucosamine-6-phosphate deacetylase [Ceratosolen solmsi marchali]|uniref:N-acetylglucosamine-6-phosphate deacetylase n=1 Tax=Ceratosolen solmsi marchali TaxID=326594 RepID=A0AAJ7DXC8_9HYME|nr:PREDICTED: putative N-acetylglucosamine-6-phosphate deacetylase [Ceratosolen solmsi marchali]